MKKVYSLLALVVVAMICCSAVVFAQSKEDAQRLHKEAYALQEKSRSNEDLKEAVAKYEAALEIYQRVGDTKNACLAYQNLALVYRSLSQYQKAVDCCEKVLGIARRIGDKEGEAWALGGLGDVYGMLAQYEKAAEYFEKSLQIARKIGDKEAEYTALENIGRVYSRRGQNEKAMEYYAKSLEKAREAGDRNPRSVLSARQKRHLERPYFLKMWLTQLPNPGIVPRTRFCMRTPRPQAYFKTSFTP